MELSFQTDAWTSPSHKAYVAVTVAFEFNGVQLMMLLDIVEVAKSHSEINLAAAFAKILDDFGISDKVSCIIQRIMNNRTHCTITCDNAWNNDTMIDDLLGGFQPIERGALHTSSISLQKAS